MKNSFLLLVAFVIWVAPVSAQEDCALAPQLFVDRPAQVIASGGVNVRVRADANSDLISRLQLNSIVDVYAGPICAGGLNWWLVGDDFLVGWAVEGMDGVYWIQPFRELIPAGLEGVALTFDATIFGNAIFEPVAAGQANSAFAYPDHISVRFPDYPIGDRQRFASAQIHVYPVDAYDVANPQFEEERGKFDAVMTVHSWVSHYLAPDGLPEIPPESVAHTYSSQFKFLDFQSGVGFRYVTLLTQNYSAIGTNMTYIYQGMTSDGDYYVSARFPVYVTLLDHYQYPDGVAEGSDLMGRTIFQYDNQNGWDSYHVFQAGATFVIDGFTPDMFTPDLRDLDAIMASLIVENAS